MAVIDGKVFFSSANLMSMLKQFPEYSLMAIGIMLAMISGGIDLSTVSIANLTAVLVAITLVRFVPEGASAQTFTLVTVNAGNEHRDRALCGLLNGALVSKRVTHDVVTLGSMLLFTGICMVLTEGKAFNGYNPMFQRPWPTVFGFLPVSGLIFIICAGFTGYCSQKQPLAPNCTCWEPIHATKIAGIKNVSIYTG